MRSFRLALAAALIVGAAGSAAAQGRNTVPDAPVDPAKAKAVDDAYRGRCEAKAEKQLCSCVITVAGVSVPDPVERQVFFDYMMGDVDKAKATRAMFDPNKNMRFNVALQRADTMLGQECDKLKPKGQPTNAPAEQPKQ